MLAILILAIAPEFHLQQRTSRADWYALDGLKVDVAKCEQFLEKTERQFGVHVPRFEYLRVRSSDDVLAYSALHVSAPGVAEPGPPLRAISKVACSKHEIVHLVLFSIGRMSPLFEEGLASMLGKDFNWYDRRRGRQLARKRGETFETAQAVFLTGEKNISLLLNGYLLADDWIRHLVKRYGMTKLVEFLQAQVLYGDDNDAMVFQMVYGVDLKTTFDRWLYGPSRK